MLHLGMVIVLAVFNPFTLAPTDPTAYLVVEYDVTKALPYIKKLK